MTKFPFTSYTDAHLQAAYRAIDTQRVKTGKNRGQVTMRALRDLDRLVVEASRRGHEYPYNWLVQEG